MAVNPQRNAPFVVVVVQLLIRVRLFVNPWTAARQASLSFAISQSLLKFISAESVMLSNHRILCYPVPSCPQSFPASRSFPICYTLGLLFPYFCSVTQSCHVRLSVTPWTAACQTSLSFTISRSLLKLMSIELVMSPNGLVLCHPLLLLPSIFPSIGVFCLFVSCLFYFQVFVSQVL